MGKNGKYFCVPVADILVCIGTVMALVNLLAIFFDIVCFYAMLTNRESLEHKTSISKI